MHLCVDFHVGPSNEYPFWTMARRDVTPTWLYANLGSNPHANLLGSNNRACGNNGPEDFFFVSFWQGPTSLRPRIFSKITWVAANAVKTVSACSRHFSDFSQWAEDRQYVPNWGSRLIQCSKRKKPVCTICGLQSAICVLCVLYWPPNSRHHFTGMGWVNFSKCPPNSEAEEE